MPFPEESVLFPLCAVWSSIERVCSLPTDRLEKETYSVDMPLRSKTTRSKSNRRTKRYKSILRKGKRHNRTRRVRFLGGMVGTQWFDTPLGPMTKSDKQHYDEQRHAY